MSQLEPRVPAQPATGLNMHHLDRLAAITSGISRCEILVMFKCREPSAAANDTTPVEATLYGGDKPRLVVEFDDQAEAAFAEINVRCESLDKALSLHRRLDSQLLRTNLVIRNARRKPLIRRTTLPLQQMFAWNRWELDERRSLQIIVGTFSATNMQSVQVRLAASLHIDADHHGYGPRPGDISTGQAWGWDDFYSEFQPDLHGRVTLVKDATSVISGAEEPGRYRPDSVFRIFV